MKHARLSASSAHRWMNCTGSVRLATGLPDTETEYQLEGTAAHALAATWFSPTYGARGDAFVESIQIDTENGPRQWLVDDAMRESVRMFVDIVNAAPGHLYVERTFSLALLNPPEVMFGTADAVKVDGRTLRVFDLKYGQGVVVEVKDNEQLLYYALGAILAEYSRRVFTDEPLTLPLANTPLDDALALFDDIIITIVQPRAGHVDGPARSFTVTPAELRAFADELMAKARDTQDPQAPLAPGAWCRFCPAQGQCPALAKHAQVVAQMDFDAVPVDTPPKPELMPVEVVADILAKAQVLENWFTALRAHIARELEAGRDVPGWKLVNKRPRRVWLSAEELQQWANASGLTDVELYEEPTLRSPAQIEKLVGKKNLPAELYASVSSGLTLVPASDPRPAAAIGPAEDFAALPPAIPDAEILEGENA